MLTSVEQQSEEVTGLRAATDDAALVSFLSILQEPLGTGESQLLFYFFNKFTI